MPPTARLSAPRSAGRHAHTRARAAPPLLLTILALAACSGPKDFENENDALRRERETLRERVGKLEARLGEADAKIAELRAVLDATGEGLSRDVLDALPRCAGIEIDRLSGPLDRDGEPGYPEALLVYVRPYDGRRRFVQVAGTMVVETRFLPLAAQAKRPPDETDPRLDGATLLARAELGPDQLREAYRSGFMGTHYTIQLTPAPDVRVLDGAVVISVVLHDAVTGLRHEAWRVVRVDD